MSAAISGLEDLPGLGVCVRAYLEAGGGVTGFGGLPLSVPPCFQLLSVASWGGLNWNMGAHKHN